MLKFWGDDGGRRRGAWLCTHAPRQLRDTFDMLSSLVYLLETFVFFFCLFWNFPCIFEKWKRFEETAGNDVISDDLISKCSLRSLHIWKEFHACLLIKQTVQTFTRNFPPMLMGWRFPGSFHPGFATGLLWLTAESAESAELLGHLAKNDPVYSG